MKKLYLFILGILLFYPVVFVDATVTKEDPFISVGTDFLILTPGNDNHVIRTWFNNTNIYLDLEDDGVWDFKYTRNSGEDLTITHSNPDLIKPGARIHTDKPVEYSQHLGSNWAVVPEIRNLKKEYYVDNTPEGSVYCGPCGCNAYHYSQGTYYIVVPQNSNEITTIYADYMNGTISTINVSHLSRGVIQNPVRCSNYQTTPIMRIYSEKPFYLYDKNSIIGPTGDDFYLPWQNIQKLIIIKNNTEVKIDTNNDLNYDETIINNSGVYGPFSLAWGSHIHSNNSIAIFTDWDYYVPPSDMTGNDMWSKDLNSWTYYNLNNYIIALFEDTALNFDRIKENDLISNFNFSINQNEKTTINSKFNDASRFHIYADKPFIEISDNGNGIFPYSSISVTQQSKQKYLGANEFMTMEVRVFNPFANTTIQNLTTTIRFPNSFSWLNESVVIEKKYIMNDTIIENSTVSVIPVNNEFFLNLSSLEQMQYLNIEYQLKTPLQIGNFEFEPVTIGYEAETWNMPG